jgi:hypothetical protein
VSHVLRLSACAAALATFFVGLWAARPVLLHDLGLDLWTWPALQQNLDSELERRQELARRWQVALRRDEFKNQICGELIAGRITLREAVRRFEELPEPSERLQDDLRFRFPQGTDEERLWRHVLEWADDLAADHPGRDAAALRRLREEYRAAFGQAPITSRRDPAFGFVG